MPERNLRIRRVLLVDDDEEDYLLTKELIAELGVTHELFWVSDYHSAIDANRHESYDVCLVDYRLGGAQDGIELTRELIHDGHKMPVILLTGQDDREVDHMAGHAGAADFLVKGEVSSAMLERAIRYAIQSHAALRALQDSYRTAVGALAAVLELRDDQTGAHAARVTDLALRLTKRVAPELVNDPQLEYGFLLHDIGKIGVPDGVVLKPGPLDHEELEQMRSHVTLGEQILQQVPHLQGIASEIVAAHHERWDGTGYPRGLKGHEIPLAARIFAVVDAFDAITNDRPYRPAQSIDRALSEIRAGAGTQFDPSVTDVFLALMQEHRAAA